jgi:HD-GYP domain-containing protein (c-di-GMP phosphodiesterase class II)
MLTLSAAGADKSPERPIFENIVPILQPRSIIEQNALLPGISLAEVLSALSFALDLTEGAVPGHALRSCLLGMRIGKSLGLPADRMTSLYYALLLKDIGCSSNAARLCQIIGGGDERRVKAGVKLEDWTRPASPKASTFELLWNNVLPNAGPVRRAAGILVIGLTQHRNNEEMITLRCDRGAQILRKLGLGDVAAEAVRGLDEHWDGSGYPERRKGYAIPIESRILALAQHLDVFASEQGPEVAIRVMQERAGRWFDPELVRLTEALDREATLWWDALAITPESETRAAVLDLASGAIHTLSSTDIDLICEAFADVVDAKSSFTFRHSLGVTEAADRIAATLGLDQERRRFVHRAALLHDLGKLRVPNSILDKPGKLDAEEWRVVAEHPRLTREILSRIRHFDDLAAVAGAHHEKLDGSGYPDRLTAERLPLEARIIAVADIYGALTEDRPYRPGMAPERALEIIAQDTPHRLDADCYQALRSAAL